MSDQHPPAFDTFAVIGAGPVGSIMAAHLARLEKKVYVVDIQEHLVRAIREQGIAVEGKGPSFTVRVTEAFQFTANLERLKADWIIIAVKSNSLDSLLEELKLVLGRGQKILILQNGIDNEERAAERFGAENVFRIVPNYAGGMVKPGLYRLSFFNPPNYVGACVPANEAVGRELAALITRAGLETVFTSDIKKQEWIKTILAAGLMPVCATTGLNMKDAMDNDETRCLCERILAESISVACKAGYKFEDDFYEACLSYLSKTDYHKPSSSVDLEAGNPVEYVFQPIIDYGKKLETPTPCLQSLTWIMRTLEKERRQIGFVRIPVKPAKK